MKIKDKSKFKASLEGLELKSKSIKGFFPEGYKSVEIKNKLDKIKEHEKKVNTNNMIYHSSKESFDFNAFKTIRSFGEDIYDIYYGKITIEYIRVLYLLLEYILNFKNKARPKNKNDKKINK